MNGDMKQKARRILRALNNMRDGRWREFVMPPQDRLDAAWLVHRYQQLRGNLLFSEASMQAGTEFLLMIIQGDERELKAWVDTSPLAWCPQCLTHRLRPAGERCRAEGCSKKLVAINLEEQWAEFKAWVFTNLAGGKVDLFSAAAQLSVDDETLKEWVLDEYFMSRVDQATACRILDLDAAALIATRFDGTPALIVDDLPPIDSREALATVRRVAGIGE